MKAYIKSLLHLFFPRYCAVCSGVLADGELFMCTDCRWNMPLTNFWNEPENPMRERLSELFEIRNAAALFFYQKHTGYEKMIHSLKYENKPQISYFLGEWLGSELKCSGLYDDIDYIVPVPLHTLRFIKRGYNQSEYFARGLSKSMNVDVNCHNLVRLVYNTSQTRRSRSARWGNVSDIFGVNNPEEFEGKHLLIVDDVLTTGATVESCVKIIRSTVENCQISVVSIATSSKDIFGK